MTTIDYKQFSYTSLFTYLYHMPSCMSDRISKNISNVITDTQPNNYAIEGLVLDYICEIHLYFGTVQIFETNTKLENFTPICTLCMFLTSFL